MSLNSRRHGLEGYADADPSTLNAIRHHIWLAAPVGRSQKGGYIKKSREVSGRNPAAGPGPTSDGKVPGRNPAAGPGPTKGKSADHLWEIAPYAQGTVEREIEERLLQLSDACAVGKEEIARLLQRLAELVEIREGDNAAVLWWRCAAALGDEDALDYIKHFRL
ncbi:MULTISPECIES: hypothetical protein [unclassified Kitasatospora]|uniref:hypothetical protein n=1 Tax=unclassified Kitasatospora TaxID=2633591 RepID=UPI0012F933C4|nr:MULTISPECIES: hypothetical protein [unclassified Kitasatospora]